MNKFVCSFSLLLCCLLFSGCGEKPKPIKQSSAPSFSTPSAAAAAQGLGRFGNSNQADSNVEINNILIDDVLKRDDLSDAARDMFLTYKGNGIPALNSRRIEQIIRENSPEYVRSSYTDYRNPARGQIPTLAKTPPTKHTVTYSDKRHQGFERYFGRLDFVRMGLEHFKKKKVPLLSAANKTRTIKFIDDVISATPYKDSKPKWEKLLAEAKALAKIQQGPRYDPMFMYCHALTTSYGGRPAEAVRILEDALDKFQKEDYPARIVVLAHHQLVNVHSAEIDEKVWVKKTANYYAAMDYWLSSDFRAKPHEHQYVYEKISDFMAACVYKDDWDMLDAFIESFSQQTHLPGWIRAMVQARYNTRNAWRFRGGGMADTVTEKGWMKFAEHQKKAAGYFKKAHEINPLFPEAASEMIEICRTGYSDETEDEWFEKAIEADANYFPAYTGRLHGLTPQWGGSFEKMIEFSRKHALKKRTEPSMVPYLLIRCRNSLISRGDIPEERLKTYLGNPKFQSDLIKAVDLLIESETGPLLNNSIRDKNFLLSLKAVFYVQAGDMDSAHDTFEKLGKKLSNDALDHALVDAATLEAFRSPSFALTSEYQEDARKLEKLFGNSYEDRMRNAREILELAKKVLRENSDPTGSIFFKKIQDQVRLERAYANGAEIQLPFDSTMMLWNCGDIRHFEFDTKDSVFIDNRKLDLIYKLTSIVRTPGSKVIEMDIEFPEDKQPGSSALNELTPAILPAMLETEYNRLAIGLNRGARETWHSSARVKRRRSRLWFGYARQTKTRYVYSVELVPRKANLRIYIAKEYFEVYVNDRFIMRTHHPSAWSEKSYFVLTQPLCMKGRGKFKISNIRLKQWNGKPYTYEATKDELIEKFSKEFKQNPDDKWSAFWFAHAYHKSNKLQEAIEQYEKSIELGIPESVAGFYLGDANDRLKQYDKAKKWYEIAANELTEDFTEMPRISQGYLYSNPQHWAAYRLAWINHTSPDEGTRKSHKLNEYAPTFLPHNVDWIDTLDSAQLKAIKGDFEGAAALAKTTLSKCSAENEQQVLDIISAYESEKPYIQTTGSVPFYLKVEKTFPFFRHFEDGMPPEYVESWHVRPESENQRMRSTD